MKTKMKDIQFIFDKDCYQGWKKPKNRLIQYALNDLKKQNIRQLAEVITHNRLLSTGTYDCEGISCFEVSKIEFELFDVKRVYLKWNGCAN